MKNKAVKTLSVSALGVQLATILLTYLLYANQEAVKKVLSGTEEIAMVHSVPVPYFIVCVCPAVFYFCFAGFCVYMQNREGSHRTGTIVFFVSACIMEVAMGYLPGIGTLWVSMLGVSELASYSVLGNAISVCTKPFHIVAFGLFALSAGGGLFGVEKPENRDQNDRYFTEDGWRG